MIHFYCMDQTAGFHTSFLKLVLNQDKVSLYIYIYIKPGFLVLFQVYTIVKSELLYFMSGEGEGLGGVY